jgi:predicted XRE-type DNA-binding protein
MKKNYEISSGNVFADLQLQNPEEYLAKAYLAQQINTLIEVQGLTQEGAARLLDVDQPKISALSTGKLAGFSLSRLLKFLTILGYDVTIKVNATSNDRKARLAVSLPRLKKQQNSPQKASIIQANKRKV